MHTPEGPYILPLWNQVPKTIPTMVFGMDPLGTHPRGSIYTTIMESGPKDHPYYGFWDGPSWHNSVRPNPVYSVPDTKSFSTEVIRSLSNPVLLMKPGMPCMVTLKGTLIVTLNGTGYPEVQQRGGASVQSCLCAAPSRFGPLGFRGLGFRGLGLCFTALRLRGFARFGSLRFDGPPGF